MSKHRSAFDRLKYAVKLWRTERNATDARSAIDELVRDHPDSEEARAALELLAEIDGAGAVTTGKRRDRGDQQFEATLASLWGIRGRLSTLLEGIGALLIGLWLIQQGMEPGASIMVILGIPVLLAGVVMTIIGLFKLMR